MATKPSLLFRRRRASYGDALLVMYSARRTYLIRVSRSTRGVSGILRTRVSANIRAIFPNNISAVRDVPDVRYAIRREIRVRTFFSTFRRRNRVSITVVLLDSRSSGFLFFFFFGKSVFFF